MDKLSTKLSGLNMAQKRSFVGVFLSGEASKGVASKQATRLELARAKNKKRVYQNMLKTKERIEAQISKLRELEVEYEAVIVDVKRLKDALQGD